MEFIATIRGRNKIERGLEPALKSKSETCEIWGVCYTLRREKRKTVNLKR